MRHWTPPLPPPPANEPARKPWEIAVDVVGMLMIGGVIAWLTWAAIAPAVAALGELLG